MSARSLLGVCTLGLLVSACGDKAASIPPEDVLARSAIASQQLTSARYESTGTMQIVSPEGAAAIQMNARGMLGSSGRQIQMLLNLTANVQPVSHEPFTLTTEMEIIVLEEEETYLNMHQFHLDPDPGLFPPDMLGQFSNQWWILESQATGASSVQSVAADPSFVRAQSQIVTVTRDLGIESFHGRDVHHYEVEIDREKLMDYLRQIETEQGDRVAEEDAQKIAEQLQAQGSLRIDTETYLVQWISWSVEPIETDTGTVEGSFEITLSDHNAADPISPPASAKPFNPFLFFQDPTIEVPDLPSDLPPGVDEEMLQQMLQNQSASFPSS